MDNIQDAINSLEISLIRNADEIMTDCFSRKTLKTAIKALERQLPIGVGENLGDYENEYYCIKCNNNLNYEHQLYCEFCGQRQQW